MACDVMVPICGTIAGSSGWYHQDGKNYYFEVDNDGEYTLLINNMDEFQGWEGDFRIMTEAENRDSQRLLSQEDTLAQAERAERPLALNRHMYGKIPCLYMKRLGTFGVQISYIIYLYHLE